MNSNQVFKYHKWLADVEYYLNWYVRKYESKLDALPKRYEDLSLKILDNYSIKPPDNWQVVGYFLKGQDITVHVEKRDDDWVSAEVEIKQDPLTFAFWLEQEEFRLAMILNKSSK